MTKRLFTGSRPPGGGEAYKMKRLEIMKGGKLPMTNTERYKHILKKKVQEYNEKSQMNPRAGFILPGAKFDPKAGPQMSKRAQEAIKQMSQRKAAKEAKMMRRMVPIVPRNYGSYGRLDSKGNVFDEVNNLVLKVDGKKGKVFTMSGWTVGKYRPKGALHEMMMKDAILKNSPYHIKLRQLELQRQVEQMYAAGRGELNGPYAPVTLADLNVINVQGHASGDEGHAHYNGMQVRGNLGVGAWGVMSSNVHGTFAENVHGGFADNVWGRASSNIWGGIGDPGNFWSKPGRNIWTSGRGTGQKNYIGMGFSMIAAFFGFGNKKANARARAMMAKAGVSSRAPSAPMGRPSGGGGRR